MIPDPIYHMTSVLVKVTYIFYITPWIFYDILKNSSEPGVIERIFHIYTSY